MHGQIVLFAHMITRQNDQDQDDQGKDIPHERKKDANDQADPKGRSPDLPSVGAAAFGIRSIPVVAQAFLHLRQAQGLGETIEPPDMLADEVNADTKLRRPLVRGNSTRLSISSTGRDLQGLFGFRFELTLKGVTGLDTPGRNQNGLGSAIFEFGLELIAFGHVRRGSDFDESCGHGRQKYFTDDLKRKRRRFTVNGFRLVSTKTEKKAKIVSSMCLLCSLLSTSCGGGCLFRQTIHGCR